MKEFELKKILDDKKELDKRIDSLKLKKDIFESVSAQEVLGHLAKAKHNLDFSATIKKPYEDWTLVSCYYSSYHAAISLNLAKGYFSKTHEGTLCLLIWNYHSKGLTEDEIMDFNKLDATDILSYVESMNERRTASYSTKIGFDDQTIKGILMKTRLFVAKAEDILKKEGKIK